jgi:hypothetical protein
VWCPPVGQCGDLVGDRRLERGGQVVAHSGKDDQPGAGDRPGGREPAGETDQRVGVTVHDKGGLVQPAQQGTPTGGGHDRGELTQDAVGVVGQVEAMLGGLADGIGVDWKSRRADDPEDTQQLPYGRFAVAGRHGQHGGKDPGMRAADVRRGRGRTGT